MSLGLLATPTVTICKAAKMVFNVAPGNFYLSQYLEYQEANGTSATVEALAGLAGGTDAAFVTTVLTNLGLADDAGASAFLTSAIAANGRGAALEAAITALDNVAADDATYGAAKTAFDSAVTTSVVYSTNTANNSTDSATLAAAITDEAIEASAEVAGKSFALTTNADVLGPNSLTAANKTTQGDDLIYANTDGNFSGSDVIDAAGGTDTLYSVQDTTAAETITPVLTSVEKVYVDVNDGTAGTAHTYTFNASTATGLDQLWVNAYSGSTTGTEDTFAITQVGTDVTIGIKDGDGEYNVTPTFKSVTGSTDSATLALDKASVDTVTMAGIETVNVSIAGGASTSSSNASTIATLTVAAASALNITGDRNLTVTNTIDFKNATSSTAIDGTIDATGMTGNLTLTSSGGDNISFNGGSGKNTIVVGAGNDTLVGGNAADTFTTGAGDDTVTGNGGNDTVIMTVAQLTKADTISLGDGDRDAIITGATTLNGTSHNASALAILNGSGVSGVEVLGTSSAAVTAIDASVFEQNIFRLTGDNAKSLSITNVAGETLELTGNGTAADTGNADAITVSGSLPNQTFTLELNGSATALNVRGEDAAAGDAALVLSSGISTVNIVSTTTNSTPSSVTNTIEAADDGNAAGNGTHTIDNVSAGSFVVTGDVDLVIASGATTGFTNAVSLDASAFTGDLTVTGSASADVIKGGSGADTITAGDGNDVLTGGAGIDTFIFAKAASAGAPSSTLFEEITDFELGSDIIDHETAVTVDSASADATATVAKVSSEGIATFHADDDTLAERIVAATKGMDADGDFVVFEHSGNSYVYLSGDANATQDDGVDVLIKLTGVTGISDSTIDANNNLILA